MIAYELLAGVLPYEVRSKLVHEARAAAARLIELYERGSAAETSGGHAESAAKWRAELEAGRR